jgi:hypothetical protein
LKRIARRACAVVAGALLAGSGLTACDQPNVAAQIGSEVITQDRLIELQQDVGAIFEALAGQTGLTTSEVLTMLVAEKISAEVVEATGNQELIGLIQSWTPESVSGLVDEALATGTVEPDVGDRLRAIPPTSWDLAAQMGAQVAAYGLEQGVINAADYIAALETVEVNPRYGDLVLGSNLAPLLTPADHPWQIPASSLTATQPDAGFELAPETAG